MSTAVNHPPKKTADDALWERLRPRSPDLSRSYSYDELAAVMEETNRPHELWDGQLIMSPPPDYLHQRLVLRLARRLEDFVEANDLGVVAISPIGMLLAPRRMVEPDVLFVAKAHLARINKVVRGPADLVVEVLSEHGRQRDRIDKRDLYAQHGIPEYWMVDPEAQTVEVLTLTRGEYTLASRTKPGEQAASVLLAGFTLDVAALFRA